MVKWLKQQFTEISAWAGFLMIIGAFLFPRSVFVFIGIVLIAIDDDKAKSWCAKMAPWLSEKVDDAAK